MRGTEKHRAGVTTGAETVANAVSASFRSDENLRGDSMDIVNVCTVGLMLSSAALFAGNAVYDYKFGKKTTAVVRKFESEKPSSVIDDVLNQTLLVIAICTGIAFVFEELALHLQNIENVQAQYMVQFSLNVFIKK